MTAPDKPRALEDMGQAGDARLFSPSAARNRDPLLGALRGIVSGDVSLLEIASGTGEHAVHICTAMPGVLWQPSELADDALASIAAWKNATALPNLLDPVKLDMTVPGWWGCFERPFDVVLSLNMIHIAPWEAALGLFNGAGEILKESGALILYGPFSEGGVHNAASNEEFDRSLKARDPRWGVRDIDDLCEVAARHDLLLEQRMAMPANNQTLVFRKARP